MAQYRIFIVEDDPWYGEILQYHLSLNPDFEITRFSNAKDCLAALGQKPDLITLDYSLPDATGKDLLQKIKAFDASLPVIMISGQEDVSTAVGLLKLGAADYLIKDDNTKDLLWNAIIRIRENQALKQEVAQLREELGQRYDFSNLIIGNSPVIRRIFSLLEKAVRSNINVSITGETGTGKEVAARAIHYNSERKKKPFVAINMAAIPKDLLESELFGHEKGAFTGAVGRKTGKFEEAQKGTLFLDEIAELDISLQTKLLRVIQERELVRLGGSEKVTLDVRLIVATHKNLAEEVKKGNFREDLYYRIVGLPIELPPLRERGNDILLLAKHFLVSFTRTNKMPELQLSSGAKDKLMQYAFPGNVRELKAVMELAAVMCDGSEIQAEDLTFHALAAHHMLSGSEKTLKAYNREIISHFLRKYDGNVLKVAEKLDIGKSTIYKMIQDKQLLPDT